MQYSPLIFAFCLFFFLFSFWKTSSFILHFFIFLFLLGNLLLLLLQSSSSSSKPIHPTFLLLNLPILLSSPPLRSFENRL